MTKKDSKLRIPEMLAYGCGDFASVLYWTTFMKYLTYFYTDVFLLAPAIAGAFLFWSRSIDGFTDVAVGIWADRTETKWGKFRPFIIWGCFPFAIAGVLTFTTPGFIEGNLGKLVWAIVTYNLLMIMYTVVNIPYTALMGVMTNDPVVRTRLSSIKFIFAFSAGVVISFTLLPMVDHLGGKNNPDNLIAAIVERGVPQPEAEALVEAGNPEATINAVVPSGTAEDMVAVIVDANVSQVLINRLVPSGKDSDVVSALINAGLTEDRATALVQEGSSRNILAALVEGQDAEVLLEKFVPSDDPQTLLNALVPRGDPRLGWMMAFVIVGLVAIGFLLVTGFKTRERIHPKLDPTSSLSKDLKILVTNAPWLILLCTTLTWILFIALRSSIAPHYFKYFIYEGSEEKVLTFLSWEFNFSYLTSMFNGLGQVASVLGVVVILVIADKFPKRQLFIFLLGLQIACTGAYYFLEAGQIGWIIGLEAIGSFVGAPLPVLMWAMYADTADFGEWKSGRRTTALVFSASTMSQKIGWGIAAWLALQILDIAGFVANMAPSDEVRGRLVELMSVIPCAFGLVAVVIFLFFPLNEKRMVDINSDLARRRDENQ